MRKLASVRKIDEIREHHNADSLELAIVGGWQVVVRKGEFEAGELAIYFEIDSFIPDELAPFLSKGKVPKEFNGVSGNRLRTIRLRGEISQGLLLKYNDVFSYIAYLEGTDLSELLNIQKWEPPVSANLGGQPKGNFPSFLRKTDQERWQNIKGIVQRHIDQETKFECTLKYDGSSMTVYNYKHPDEDVIYGVTSRNIDLKLDQEGNSFVDLAKDSELLEWIKNFYEKTGRSIAIQGELMGPGVQGNREKRDSHCMFVFDIFDIDKQQYFSPEEREELFLNDIWLNTNGIYHCHNVEQSGLAVINIYEEGLKTLKELDIHTPEDLLVFADGESLDHPIREGVVFKSECGQFSFKAISNLFLEKED